MTHKIAVIGLGYVGLPLARLFATKFPVVGFDINQSRIDELRNGTDTTLEVEDDLLQSVLLKENPFTVLAGTDGVAPSHGGEHSSGMHSHCEERPKEALKQSQQSETPAHGQGGEQSLDMHSHCEVRPKEALKQSQQSEAPSPCHCEERSLGMHRHCEERPKEALKQSQQSETPSPCHCEERPENIVSDKQSSSVPTLCHCEVRPKEALKQSQQSETPSPCHFEERPENIVSDKQSSSAPTLCHCEVRPKEAPKQSQQSETPTPCDGEEPPENRISDKQSSSVAAPCHGGEQPSGMHSHGEERPTGATKQSQSQAKPGLYCSTSLTDIAGANTYIITVPTPVDKNNRPDLTPLYKASETVGKVLKKGDIVIYESTVYPGATEEECIPVLEKVSGLTFNEDFFAGYSPERINPGDKEHTVEKILKVTSGSTPETGKVVDGLYRSVITAGTHLAPTIKVAEAAKVIENSQRDINIAFVNELAKIFNLMDIDTHAVLEAAGTKWNFLPFRPGLVGGHCIGVDPYYLAQKAQEYGYHPEIILAGRRLNDSMGEYVASQVVKCMIRNGISVNGAEVLMLGITFKENCPDVRNTKIVDVVAALEDYNVRVSICDPWANPEEVKHEYGLDCQPELTRGAIYDAIVLGVAHREFQNLDLENHKKETTVVYDVKGILAQATARL